jgi:WD40 repeat protein
MTPSTSARAVVQVFGGEPFRTDDDLLALAFAADGSLWSVEDPGLLRHWDVAGGKLLSWQALSDLAMLWQFSDDAGVLASAGDEVILWDVAQAQALAFLPQPAWVTALAFNPRASLLATGHDDGTVHVWDVATRQALHSWQAHHRPVSALAFSREGTRLASAGEDKAICLWDPDGGRLAGTLLGHTDRVPALAWAPGGGRLYSAGWDTTVRVWDTATCEPIILLNSHAGQVTALALSPEGDVLAAADAANAVHVWAVPANRELRVFREHTAEVRTLAFRRDGRLLASGGTDRAVRVVTSDAWQVTRDQEQAAPSRTTEEARLVPRPSSAVTPHLSLLRTGGGTALGVGHGGAGPLVHLEGAGVLDAVVCSPDGRTIAGSAGDVPLRLWDARTGKLRHTLQGQAAPITALAFMPDSARLASGSPRGTDIWLWDVPTGEPALLIPEAVDGCSVEALAFHPQGRLLAAGGVDWLATGGSDGAVCVWDVEARTLLVSLDGGAVALAFHPAGTRLAVAGLGPALRVWDAADWGRGGVRDEPRLEWAGHDEAVTAVAYSPDGRLLASGSTDHTVRLWDADTGAALGAMTLDTQVKALSFSPDGRSLFTGNGNSSCYQLEVRSLLGS